MAAERGAAGVCASGAGAGARGGDACGGGREHAVRLDGDCGGASGSWWRRGRDGEPVSVERRVFRAWIWERPLNPATRKPDERWRFPWEEEILPTLWELIEEFDVWALQYDSAYFAHEAQQIADRWDANRVVEFAQFGRKMEEASQELYSAVVNGVFAFDGDVRFARHMDSAVAVQSKSGRGAWRLVKGQAQQFMDAAVAAAMCNWSVGHVPEPAPGRTGVSVWIPGDEEDE